MLQRVKKQDVQRDSWIRPDPVDFCLNAWGNWMCSGGHRNLEVVTMRGLVGESDGHGSDPHEAQHSQDMQIGAATDAMISGLSRLHYWAIFRSCGFSSVWQFPNADLITTAADARNELMAKLKKNECTRNLF